MAPTAFQKTSDEEEGGSDASAAQNGSLLWRLWGQISENDKLWSQTPWLPAIENDIHRRGAKNIHTTAKNIHPTAKNIHTRVKNDHAAAMSFLRRILKNR